jgi:hypothetical protein
MHRPAGKTEVANRTSNRRLDLGGRDGSKPYGPIAVAWQKTSQGFRLEINVPAETSGTVGVPTSSNSDVVTDNGRPIEKNEKMSAASVSNNSARSRPGYIYFADLGPGAHVIQVTEGKK